MPESQQPAEEAELTRKRQRFIEEYPKDCNATQAAIRAGYAPTYARQEGSRLYTNVGIRAAIDARITALAMPADVALKLTADIASTRLNDFMIVREVQGYLQEEQYVTVLIAHAQNEIKTIEAFIARRRLVKEARSPFDAQITALYAQILKWEVLIERYGDEVSLLVPGRPVVQRVADLDLVALAEADEAGRLKSFKHTKDGVQVEMLDAQAAIRDILKMHGKFITKVEVKDTTPVNYDQLSDAALEEVLNATRPATQ